MKRVIVFGITLSLFGLLIWTLDKSGVHKVHSGTNGVVPETDYGVLARIARRAESVDSNRVNEVRSRNALNNWSEVPEAKAALDAIAKDYKWLWRRPIAFYGVVCDEEGNPVGGAKVRFEWSAETAGGVLTSNVITDGGGYFSLQGQTGYTLTVSAKHSDYYSGVVASMRFNYAEPWDIDYHRPNYKKPILFTLKKRGFPEQLIQRRALSYRSSDSPALVRLDLLGQRQVDGEPWDLGFAMSHGPEVEVNGQRRYDWSIEVTANGGGLILHDEEFPFLAPEGGYQPVIRASMRADDPEWVGFLRRKCFFKTREGANYGRIDFELHPFPKRSSPRVLVREYFLNPAGSRNLEYDMDLDVGEKYYVPR